MKKIVEHLIKFNLPQVIEKKQQRKKMKTEETTRNDALIK